MVISGTPPSFNPNINVPRLLADLAITPADWQKIAALAIPNNTGVTSLSAIKPVSVKGALHIVHPERNFNVFGKDSPSDVGQQPLGQTTIDGALNRLDYAVEAQERDVPGASAHTGWFSVENGIFRVAPAGAILQPTYRAGVLQFIEGADLSTVFDPTAEYDDRAVVAIRLPGYPTIVQISPALEAVRFPREAVLAAYNAPGSFEQNTVGSKLAEMGLVKNKQDPHIELTANRPGGPLPREDQMARVILRALVRLTEESRT